MNKKERASMTNEDPVFAILLYKRDNKKGQFVVADDPSNSNEPYCDCDPSPDYVVDRAREMIFRTFVYEFKKRGHKGIDRSIETMQKVADSAVAKLIQLPHSAKAAQRLNDDVGFMMSQFFVPNGDWSDAIYVKALVVKVSKKSGRKYFLEATQRMLLPAVNSPKA